VRDHRDHPSSGSRYDTPPPRRDSVTGRDRSALEAVRSLLAIPGVISGDQMRQALLRGIGDRDNHSATSELREFRQFAAQHPEKLSPEAKQILAIYERYAGAARQKGQSGISSADFSRMVGEMRQVRDVGAQRAVDALGRAPGPVSGEQMTRAISNGTADRDGQLAGREFEVFERWAWQHPGKLSPEARQVMDIYRRYAAAARADGQTGLSDAAYARMLSEMRAVHSGSDPRPH